MTRPFGWPLTVGMKWIDIPPIWLLGSLVLAYLVSLWSSLSFGGGWADFLGGLLVGGGLILMGLAVIEMRKARTTVIPHMDPNRLVTTGIFRRTRNPIYLGDALVLAGLILRWDAPLALPLIPIFVWIIERRFILAEEDRLRRAFRQDFYRYTQDTRRWI